MVDHELHYFKELPKVSRHGNMSYESTKEYYFAVRQNKFVSHFANAKRQPHFGPRISGRALKRDRIEIFSKLKYFYSLDALTYRSVEAALAGAISVVIPVDGVSKEEWIDSLYPGIAYGEDDIANAIRTLPQLLPRLLNETMNQKNMIISFLKNVTAFFNINSPF